MGDANNTTQSPFTWTTTNDAAVKSSRSSGSFSPAVIAVIGILGAAFLLVSYYTMVAKFCTSRGVFRGRRRRRPHGNRVGDLDRDPDVDNDEWNGVDGTVYNVVPRTQGLDEAIIKAIPVFKYNGMKVSGTYDRFADGMKVAGTYDVCADGMKVAGTCATCSDGMLEKGTCSTCGDTGAGEPKIGHSGRGLVCSVCLSEFQYEELLRMLPKCNHAFHVSCIDTWLRSHSTCPLCRANVVGNPNPYQAPPPSSPSSSSSSLSVQATPGVITNDSASSTSPTAHDGPSSSPGSSVSEGPFAASAPVVSPILPSRVIVNDVDAVIMTGNSITNSSGSSATGHPFSSTCKNMAVRNLATLEQVRSVEGIRNGGHGAVWKRKLNHMDQLELSEDEREQLEKQMQYWGGLIRCFSTGRAMEQTPINPPSSNVDNNAATVVMAIMRRSSSLSSYITKSASDFDRQQQNTTDESTARTKTKKNRNADHLQHPNSNQQEALASADHLAMSTGVPSSSSSCSTSRDFFKSRSLNHIIADGDGLKSFTKSALGLEDPLMSRMLLSLKGPRAVKRSFSGGRFFGFKMKSTTTSTDPDACSRLPI